MLSALLGFTFLLTPQTFDFYTRGPYDSGVPKPEAVLGYGPGEHETTYHLQEEVVRSISDHAKGRVMYIPYGKSTEGKQLRILAITSPQNMRKIEQIRKDIASLAEGKSGSDEIVHRSPAIVWINECIHGDEPASFEAGMWLLYNLAASRSPEVEKMLDNCVVILNPSYNPDGHERFVVWYNSVQTGDPDRDAIEQHEPGLVSGRLNHYRFDMNRDRIAMSQAETQQEVAEYLRWNPQAYADQHGQVSTYFFPPASLSVNVNVDRVRYNKWAEIFGHATGKAFDRQGFAYYVKDVFDLYYPGYLDSWTTLNGAIGMTHETDAGYAIKSMRDDGSVATLRGAMARHFTSALAVIEAVSDHREDILQDYAKYRREAVQNTAIGKYRFVTLHSNAPEEIDALEAQLKSEGIRTSRPKGSIPTPAGQFLWGGKEPSGNLAQGTSLVVPLQQPQGHLAKSLFEADSDFEPEFVKEQLRRRAEATGVEKYPRGDPAEFYDFTGWNLAFAHNLDAWFTETAPPESGANAGTLTAARGFGLGFIAPPSERASLEAADLLRLGVNMEVTTKPLVWSGERTWPPGSFIIYRDRNESDLEHLIRLVERSRGPIFDLLGSSYPDEGREGAGSESIHGVAKPNIGIMFGDDNSMTGLSGIWFVMEKIFKLPFTPMHKEALSGDLNKYSCIVFPRGQYDAPSDKLKEWISNGGCAVVLGAQGWVMNSLVKLDDIKTDKGERPGTLPGALFRAELNPKSFLSYGYAAHGSNEKVEIAVPIEGDRFYKARAEGGGAVVLSKDDKVKKLLSGWEWPDDTEKNLKGAVWAHDQPVGGGHVIVFMGDPTERAMWPGLYKLLLNAMILGPRHSGNE